MKTFSKILMVILILIFLVVAVLGFLEMPVAPEGEELTAAQRVLVALKTHLSTILTAIGLPLDAVLLALFVAINKQAAATTSKAGVTSGEVELIKNNQQSQQCELKTVGNNVYTLSNKLDVLTEMLSETLLMSDMPASLRERIQDFKTHYDKIKTADKNTVTDEPSDAVKSATTEVKEDCAEVIADIKTAVETAVTAYNGIKETVSRF